MIVKEINKPGCLISTKECKNFKSGYVILGKGEVIGKHKTGDGEEILIILEGIARIIVEKEIALVESPATVLIPPNTLHSVENDSEKTLKYVYIVANGK